jgi:hypothetical protein
LILRGLPSGAGNLVEVAVAVHAMFMASDDPCAPGVSRKV